MHTLNFTDVSIYNAKRTQTYIFSFKKKVWDKSPALKKKKVGKEFFFSQFLVFLSNLGPFYKKTNYNLLVKL